MAKKKTDNTEKKEKEIYNKKLGELCPIFIKDYLENNGENEFRKKYYKLIKFLPNEFKNIFLKKMEK